MSNTQTGKVLDRQTVARLIRYTRPYRRYFFIAVILTILLAILGPLRPYLVQYILDNPVVNGDYAGLRFWTIMILVLLGTEAIVMYANTYLMAWLGQSVIRDIRKEVFQHILRLRLKFFDNTPIGVLQTRTINDIETLNEVFSSGLVRIMGEMLQLIAILGMMLYTSWKLTLVVLTTLPLLLIATFVFKNKVKKAFQKVRNAVSQMNAFLQEHITGMQIIHIFNREEKEMERFEAINKRLNAAHLNSVTYYSIFYPVVELISALGIAILVWYGASNITNGEFTFGVLVAFIMYVQMFFRPIRLLADRFNTLQLGMVSGERIFKILDTQEMIPNEGQREELHMNGKSLSLSFQKVHFAYNEENWVLRDINLDVQPGNKAALVGATGSGKSTIINVLSRFYELQEGKILVNGIDIRELSLQALRKNIGVVLQDVFLFSGSIYDNITLNNSDIPLSEVEAAARRVGADAFIQKLPGKYAYEVRERGATLSLGQRQLIAFARVMVYDPRVLILDEATANIDTESEEIIQAAIDTVLSGRTSIIIAHRLSTIQKADKIFVLEKGKIMESGSHQELLQQEGMYFQLHQKQFASQV